MGKHSGLYCSDGKLCTEPSCTEQLQRCRHDEKYRTIRFLNSQEAATKIEELQRQLAEAQEVGRNLSSTWKSTEDELQRQLAERDKALEALNSVLRRDKGWGQGEIDSITDLWEQNERLLKALQTIKSSGWNDHQTAIWMQKVAAHAINPEQWPVQPEQPPHG